MKWTIVREGRLSEPSAVRSESGPYRAAARKSKCHEQLVSIGIYPRYLRHPRWVDGLWIVSLPVRMGAGE